MTRTGGSDEPGLRAPRRPSPSPPTSRSAGADDRAALRRTPGTEWTRRSRGRPRGPRPAPPTTGAAEQARRQPGEPRGQARRPARRGPSSQARVNGEKYAVTVSSWVWTTDQTNDTSDDRGQHRDRDVVHGARPARRASRPRDEQAQQQDQQRPHEVELLLHRERPVVLQRGGRVLGVEVVGAVDGELDSWPRRTSPRRRPRSPSLGLDGAEEQRRDRRPWRPGRASPPGRIRRARRA